LGERGGGQVTENEIARQIVDAAITIHKRVGPGLFESVYETLLEYELTKRGLSVVRQWPIPVVYDEVRLELGFRCDLIVENLVIVEVKAVDCLGPVHFSQVLTYLRFADRRLGILINFNVDKLKDGIKRIVNQLED
jgi:GxxExxY protein